MADARPRDRRCVDVRRYWHFRSSPTSAWLTRPSRALIEELRAAAVAGRRAAPDQRRAARRFSQRRHRFERGPGPLSAARIRPSSIKTFTIGFDEPSFDEVAPTRAGRRATSAAHHESSASISTSARELIPSCCARLDEPLGDASILPTYLLERIHARAGHRRAVRRWRRRAVRRLRSFPGAAAGDALRAAVPRALHAAAAPARRAAAGLDAQHEPRFQAAARADGPVLSGHRVDSGLDGARSSRSSSCRAVRAAARRRGALLRRRSRCGRTEPARTRRRPYARVLHRISICRTTS